jgi:hypothetical protein
MAQMMATGDDLLDSWIAHAREYHASTPELMALMLIQLESAPNKLTVATILAATAVQRIAATEDRTRKGVQ